MFSRSIIKIAVKYGILGGLCSVSLFLLLYYLGKNPLLATKWIPFGLILIPIFVFFSIKEFRDFKNGRELHFWQGILLGFVNYLLITLISAFFVWGFIEFVDKKVLTEFIDFNIKHVETNKDQATKTFGKKAYDEVLANIKTTTAYVVALDEFWRKLLIGFVATFIVSIILRKKRNKTL